MVSVLSSSLPHTSDQPKGVHYAHGLGEYFSLVIELMSQCYEC